MNSIQTFMVLWQPSWASSLWLVGLTLWPARVLAHNSECAFNLGLKPSWVVGAGMLHWGTSAGLAQHINSSLRADWLSCVWPGENGGLLARATVPVLRSTDMTVGDSLAVFPVDDFCTLDGYGTKPKLTLCSRIRKLSSKNTGIFQYNPLSIKAVIPYILLACQNHRHSGVAYGHRKKSVATASR